MYKSILRAEEKEISAALLREVEALEPAARPLARHVIEAGGKRIRPLLTVLMGKALGCGDPLLYALAAGIELLHGATLMHDDVLDVAETRRGAPAAHTVFGAGRAILAGDVLLAACMRIMLRSRKFDIIDSVALAAAQTAAGEVEEMDNLRNVRLDFDGYMRIIIGKTARLVSCACEIGAMLAGAAAERIGDAAAFGLELGIAFQLVDDALDVAPESVTGKPVGGDLREGKFTLLAQFYLEGLPQTERGHFLRGFSQGSFSEAELRELVSRMRACGCAERLRALAGEHLLKAGRHLERLPAGREKDTLGFLLNYIKERDH
ncbi:MAG: polyprenyl synthetase family protein [Deltaproteobacteria bacterium]|nr:polyprenyl synthetase family protein [Deltaproteobacteria bacterium]